MALTHFKPTTDPATIGEHIRQYGYAIVDDLADANLLERLEAETKPYIETSAFGRDEYDGRLTRRTGALIARSPASRELVMNPVVVATVKNFLSHASAIQLHTTQIISISPGETQQKLDYWIIGSWIIGSGLAFCLICSIDNTTYSDR